MVTIVDPYNPFAVLKQQASVREEEARLLAERQKVEAAAERQRLVTERSLEERNRLKQEHTDRDVAKFKEEFLRAVAKRISRRSKPLKLEAINMVESYALAMVSHEDVELQRLRSPPGEDARPRTLRVRRRSLSAVRGPTRQHRRQLLRRSTSVLVPGTSRQNDAVTANTLASGLHPEEIAISASRLVTVEPLWALLRGVFPM